MKGMTEAKLRWGWGLVWEGGCGCEEDCERRVERVLIDGSTFSPPAHAERLRSWVLGQRLTEKHLPQVDTNECRDLNMPPHTNTYNHMQKIR